MYLFVLKYMTQKLKKGCLKIELFSNKTFEVLKILKD